MIFLSDYNKSSVKIALSQRFHSIAYTVTDQKYLHKVRNPIIFNVFSCVYKKFSMLLLTNIFL